MKFWAVLGSQGCREKKLPTAISKQLFRCFFNFCVQKNFELFFDLENIKKPPQKVPYLWQLGGFFLSSPDCPKQPRTSFSF